MNFFRAKPSKAPDVTDMVGKFASAWAERVRNKQGGKIPFVVDGVALNDADIGSESAILPLVIWHAENLYRYGIKESGFGAAFRADGDALLQRTVNLQKVHRSNSELLLFTLEALEDIRAHLPKSDKVPGATELRSLINQFAVAMGITVDAVPGHAASARPQS